MCQHDYQKYALGFVHDIPLINEWWNVTDQLTFNVGWNSVVNEICFNLLTNSKSCRNKSSSDIE